MSNVSKHKPDLKRLFELEMVKIAGRFGIDRKKITQEYLLDLLGIIHRRYKGFMLSDLKEAFELLICGDLDPFLPKDTQGQPDKKVFGELTVDFVLRVLNAYRKRKESREPKALLVYKKVYTEAEIKAIHGVFVADLIQWADVDKMVKPFGGIGAGSEHVYDLFAKWGLVPAEAKPEPVKEQPEQAMPRVNRMERAEDLLGTKTKDFVVRANMVKRAIEKLHKEGKTLKSIIETHDKN